MSRSLLLTGAAGIVGTLLRPFLAARPGVEVLLTDFADVGDLAPNERFVRGDIADEAFVRDIVRGLDGIVHLAGKVGPDFTFDEVLGPNIVGTQNLLAAAVAAGVPRFIFASSHHSVGYFRRGDRIDHTTAPRPDSFYGLSKAFGEAAAAYYADRHGLGVLAIRIGYVGEKAIDERRLHTWISPRDLAQLIEIGLTALDLSYEVVYGVSENPDPFFDNSNATRLGYAPQDRAVDHVADESILRATPENPFIGGHFCDS